MHIRGGLAFLGVQREGNLSRFGQLAYRLACCLPFSPLDVLIFRVVGQTKTSTPVSASDDTDMKLGQRINVWWELVY